MADKAVVVGSGASGAQAAMVLAEAGWDVVIFERGPNHFSDLTSPRPGTQFSNDELKSTRAFEDPDPELEPRTFRSTTDTTRDYTGWVDDLPRVVGGGTVHWDAKIPRYWDIDFKKKSMLGPIEGADIDDWPFDYAEIAPYYDEVELLLGAAGDVDQLPDLIKKHSPHKHPFPMPPGPQEYSSLVAASGAKAVGLNPYPFPMGINSVWFDGRPPCNNCGHCSGFGCPIHARLGGVAALRRALLTGRVELRVETFVDRVILSGRKATGVHWIRDDGSSGQESAHLVVMGASTIESARLAWLSHFPDPHDRLGRDLMFHWVTYSAGIFTDRRLHTYTGRSSTQCMDDFADPDYPGAKAYAQANGLPYFRGGNCEMGGSQLPIAEAQTYQLLLDIGALEGNLPGVNPYGTKFKQLMRATPLRDRILGIQMNAEDLPQPTNRVDLDPKVRDYRGVLVPRITYAPHKHELVAQNFYISQLDAVQKAAGASVFASVPANNASCTGPYVACGPVSSNFSPIPGSAHIMGGMRMGSDPRRSVTDEYGRVHGLDNVVVVDGSTFLSAGSSNPTNTIMAVGLRNIRHYIATTPRSSPQPARQPQSPLPRTGIGAGAAAAGAAAVAASLAARRATSADE